MTKRASLDWAKSKRDYKRAAEAAYDEIKTLFEEEPASLDGHLLIGVYVDEIVRSVVVDLMQSGDYYSQAQLYNHLHEFLAAQSIPPELLVLINVQLSASLGKISPQLKSMLETAQIRRHEGLKEPNKLADATNTVYDQEILFLANNNVELTAVPREQMVLDRFRLNQQFGAQLDTRFPSEITIEGFVFMVDYNGAYYFYGGYEENLKTAAQALAERLETCLLDDS